MNSALNSPVKRGIVAAAMISLVGMGGIAGGRPAAILAEEGETTRRPDVQPLTPPLTSPEQALATDLEVLATAEGRSLDDVNAQYVHGEKFDKVDGDLQRHFGAAFAGSWTKPGPPVESFVRFKGRATAEAETIVRASGLNVTLIPGAAFSQREMNARVDELRLDLTVLGSVDVNSWVDVENQVIELMATFPPGLEHMTEAELLRRLPERARAADVVIKFSREPIVKPAHTYGGAWMLDNGSRLCTSGFTARRGTTTGVTTAGHCTGIDTYEQPEDGLRYKAPLVVEEQGTWGDVEYHTTTGHDDFARFYANVNDFRSVRGVTLVANMDPEDAVCGFGRKSNAQHCGRIKSVNQACGNLRRLVFTNVGGFQGGDSGGPIYFGSQAFGGFYGWCSFPEEGFSRRIHPPSTLTKPSERMS